MDPLVPIIVFFRAIAEALAIRAFLSVLSIDRKGLYVLCDVVLMASVTYVRQTVPHVTSPVVLTAQVAYLLLPLVVSRGRLRERLFWTVLVNVVILLRDVVASCVYLLIVGGSMSPRTIDINDPATVTLVYCITILVTAVGLEAVIATHRSLKGEGEQGLLLPVFAFPFGSVMLLFFSYTEFVARASAQMGPIYLTVALSILTLGVAFGLQAIARRDFANQRAMADEVAAARQGKHLRATVASTARSSAGVRRLRHDLANQVDVVRELAAAGRAQEADRYLAALQEQAHVLGGRG